ncbi:MAG: GNAT family N-acetyltransferase, partial [Bacteroidota bacterium]
ILDQGGYIFIALFEGEPLGAVAMIRMEDDTYELAKMGVRPAGQGKGIGFLLGQAVIEKAKVLGAKRLYLETNSRLQPAIRLYEKLGFNRLLNKVPSPYARSNVQMDRAL